MKLSVVIPCFNELGTIGKVIEAVKASPVKDCEIIVVDDCSIEDNGFQEFNHQYFQLGMNNFCTVVKRSEESK